MGSFGPFTQWAVVFLIIFVLFILLMPPHHHRERYCETGTGNVGY